MAKSDDAKRVRRLVDLLLNYDPMEGLEPGYATGDDARNATMHPYYNRQKNEGEMFIPWPGSWEDMQRRAPQEPELGPVNLRRALARSLMRG